MSRVVRWLDRFWFAEASAARLGMLRLLVGSYAAWLLQFRYEQILDATRLPASQFQPVGVASFLSAPPQPWVINVLLVLTVIASVPFVLGLAYRVTGPLFAGLFLSVLTYYASWGSVNHPDALVTAHVFVLGLTRAADAVSLDALIRTWRTGVGQRTTASRPDPAGAWQYGFSLKLVCAVTATSYILAGIAKVGGPNGWAWASGEVLLRQVAWDGLRKELLAQPPPAYAAFLYEHVWLFALLAIGSLVVELGAPLALLDRRLGYAWVLASFPMHWGIYFVMGISFKYYLWGVAYASFFPLERVLSLVRRSIDVARTRIRPRTAGVRVPSPFALRPPMPARSAVVGMMALAWGGVMFAAGMLTAQGLTGASASPNPAAAAPPRPSASPRPNAAASPRPSAAASPRPNAVASPRPSAAASPRQSAAASPSPTPSRAPRPARTPTAAPPAAPDGAPFQVAWVGDILLGHLSQPHIDRFGYGWVFEHVRPLLQADFVIGNHEAPITERTKNYFPNEAFDYSARPASAKALADAGFTALGLSNNHVLDRGPEGLADTLRNVRESGMRPFGAGLDGDEAAAPLLISTSHGTIGVLGFGHAWTQGAVAGPNQAGTVPFSDENLARAAQAARAAGARWVVGFMQWGANYEPIMPRQRRMAASFARAGYDLVVGHHPHIVQGVEIVEGMPVLYSIGNFAFGTTGRFTAEAPGFGLVVRTSFGPRGLDAIELSCIVTDNDLVNYQPRPCDEEQARSLIQSLGPSVTFRDGKGLVVR